MARYRQRSFLATFFLFTLIIGPLLVIAYIALFIPIEYWPVGSNTPKESIFVYVMPMVPYVYFPGSILGSILFIIKQLVMR